MPAKVVETPFPPIDVDPHAGRVIRYFRVSDYAAWAAGTLGVPSAMTVWNLIDPSKGITPRQLKNMARVSTVLGFCGGFLLAYQRSSLRFWGWTENKREFDMDLEELTQRAKEGKSLYGDSPQPEWVQGAAYRNSVFSQLKFSVFPMLNLVNHPHHGTDPAKYGVSKAAEDSQ